MRLIDADELKVNCVCLNAFCVDGRTIENAPTVKAIPIEWIEKWFSQFYGEQGLEWNRCKRFMLKDWEKENEID